MTQAIKNALNNFAYDRVVTIMETGGVVTPEILDEWEKDLHGTMKEDGQKIGKARIRELVVAYILSEFSTDAFGVPSTAWKAGEISDKTIRKMKNQRKKKFADMKFKVQK
ncbi:hypothetical protein [Erwinia phage FBB1]|nr:hypothetical protein [Erwinia phage FBB1]